MNSLDDCSFIQNKKPIEDSRLTFQQSKPIHHIMCPQKNNQNYNCPICNRLRLICPFSSSTKQQFHLATHTLNNTHNVRIQNQKNQYIEKPAIKVVQPQLIRPPVINQITQQVIYYPVIHNKILLSPQVNKSSQTTPKKSKNRTFHSSGNKILTPTQFKQLVENFKLQ